MKGVPTSGEELLHQMQDRATLIEPAAHAMTDGLPDDRRRWAMAALCASVAISSLSTAIANIALPAIAA